MFIASQPNALWQFNMDFLDPQGAKVGSISWPDVAVATNARMKGTYPDNWTKNVEIVSAGRPFKIAFEYLNRDWNMDMRFTLHDGDAAIASVDCCHAKKRLHRASMHLTAPFSGDIVRRRGLFAIHYDILREGQQIGHIYEKPVLQWRRKIFIDIDQSVDAPVQLFLFSLVYNYAFN
ncbi:MAG: hypothetical protein ABI178_00110 [Rhodanobacter sp.]